MRDIYDPDPSPSRWEAPRSERLAYSAGDVLCLVGLCLAVAAGSAWAWATEPTLGIGVTIGGVFVVLESWFSAMTFLHRHPSDRRGGRWMIVLAALVPWLLGLGFAALLMILLFALSDWAG